MIFTTSASLQASLLLSCSVHVCMSVYLLLCCSSRPAPQQFSPEKQQAHRSFKSMREVLVKLLLSSLSPLHVSAPSLFLMQRK